MDILLWRSAETVKADDDADSLKTPLSDRGRKQARRMASWLDEHQPRGLRVFASPAMATVEMARLVSRAAAVDRRLGPDAAPGDLLAVAGWPHEHPAVLIIGHQPALGGLAALLLAGAEAPWTFRKGALWWFSNRTRAGDSQTILRAVMTPELVKGGGTARIAAADAGAADLESVVLRNALFAA